MLKGCNQFKFLKVKDHINLAYFRTEKCGKLLYNSFFCVLVNKSHQCLFSPEKLALLLGFKLCYTSLADDEFVLFLQE